MTFAEVIRVLMADRNITQYALAKSIGKSRSYVSELMSGKIKEPTLTVAFNIADALGVDLGSIVEMMKEGER